METAFKSRKSFTLNLQHDSFFSLFLVRSVLYHVDMLALLSMHVEGEQQSQRLPCDLVIGQPGCTTEHTLCVCLVIFMSNFGLQYRAVQSSSLLTASGRREMESTENVGSWS